MAISLVQQAQHSVNATSCTVTLGANATAGNCLVVCILGSTGTTFTSVTLGGSADNWTLAASTAADYAGFIYVDPNCAGGSTSVVVTSGTTHIINMQVFEFSGVLATSVIDKTDTGAGTTTAWSSGTTATTTQAAEVWVGTGGGFMTSGTITGPSSPWINEAQINNSFASGYRSMSGYQITSSTGTATYSGTWNSAPTAWNALVATLLGASDVSVALPVATVTIASPAPGLAMTLALPVATVAVASPAPAIPATLPLPVATVTIGTPAPALAIGVTLALPVATVTIAAPSPGHAATLALPVATVAVASPAPGLAIGTGVTLATGTVTVAAPAPSVVFSGTVILPVATVTEATPAPGIGNTVALTVASVTILAPAPAIPATVILPVATVAIAAPVPAPVIGITVALPVALVAIAAPLPVATAKVPLPVATVTIAAPVAGIASTVALTVATVAVGCPAPGIGNTVALPVATVTIAAPAPGIGKTVPLPVATVTIASPAPTVKVNRFVILPVATVAIAAHPVGAVASRNLLVSIASQAGTDDYGTAFPAGFKTTAGVVEGSTISGSTITGTTISGATVTGGTVSGTTISGSTISGSIFQGTDFLLDAAGAYFYSGTPAAGNLVLSIAQVAGSDSFGNAILPGFVTYGTQGGSQVATQVTTGAFQFWSAGSQAGPYGNNSSISVDTSGNVNIDSASIQLPSSNINGHAVNFAFLGTIGQMSHYNETNSGGWTSGGALAAGTWDVTHASALTGWMNQVNADIAVILARLQNENYMA